MEGKNDVPSAMRKTVWDYPRIEMALRCALPLIIRHADFPESPGIWGTAFALSYNRNLVFLTARHVLASLDQKTALSVPTVFGAKPVEVEMDSVSFRTADSSDFRDVSDIAVMRPSEIPNFQEGETAFYEAGGLVADLDATPKGCPLVLRGYPREDPRNSVDFETRSFNFLAHAAQGRYAGPSGLTGLHRIDIDLKEVGGAQGFSGSPVFRPVFEDGDWHVGLAGMVLRGGNDIVHFLDVKAPFLYLATLLGPLPKGSALP